MLCGDFHESQLVKSGEAENIDASGGAVAAFLDSRNLLHEGLMDYIYGKEACIDTTDDQVELLKLASSYGLPNLTACLAAEWQASLDSASALKLLPHVWTHSECCNLAKSCEQQILGDFAQCVESEDFVHLTVGQLGSNLQRHDLHVAREETVLQGVFKWVSASTAERACHLELLLQNIDFPSMSVANLKRLSRFSQSAGASGPGLSRAVNDALRLHRKRQADGSSEKHQPKRRCLKHWCPDLGADGDSACQPVTPPVYGLGFCWHDGALYIAVLSSKRVLRCRPGESECQIVAGVGAAVNGHNQLHSPIDVAVSPSGDVFVLNMEARDRRSLLKFSNGHGEVLLQTPGLTRVDCSANGVLYVVDNDGTKVQRVDGSVLTPVLDSSELPEDQRFIASQLFVTSEETVYLSDLRGKRVLRFSPGSPQPTTVGNFQQEGAVRLAGLFVTESRKIYVADLARKRIWVLNEGETTSTQLDLALSDGVSPSDVMLQGNSMYFLHYDLDHPEKIKPVYRYRLPPELVLDTASATRGAQSAEDT
ncbi:Kelch-like protein 6 [Durusdinium trenchii]|uniref:Kelch-like protein 6 n=1 Tax=Durusdinium trenchii TaxID=1381693 RepID=A0ABP0MEF7_9DINO